MEFRPRVVRERHRDKTHRGCLRALGTLSELHKAGYQRLRCMPFPSPSGIYWRLWIAPVTHFHRNHGAIIAHSHADPTIAARLEDQRLRAEFTTGQIDNGEFFGLGNLAEEDAGGIAARLIEAKPELAAAGKEWDYAYVGWFQRLIGLAERGWLPEVFSDSHPPGADAVALFDVRQDEWRKCKSDQDAPVLPLPPPGELAVDYVGLGLGDGQSRM